MLYRKYQQGHDIKICAGETPMGLLPQKKSKKKYSVVVEGKLILETDSLKEAENRFTNWMKIINSDLKQ